MEAITKKQAQNIAEELFKSYPSVDEFHITGDGQAFELKHNAEAHASFLDKKEPLVITITRDGIASDKVNKVEPEEEFEPEEETELKPKKGKAGGK